MSSPIFEAVCAQLALKRHPLHMPGHKGVLPFPLTEVAPFDVTELPLTGSLYENTAPFTDCEQRLAAQYQAGATLLSAGGSTLCIQAMLALFCPRDSQLLMGRACHVSAVHACGLLGIEPVWLYPNESSGAGTPGRITPEALALALKQNPQVQAVYLTSPDYFGVLQDIAGLAAVCHAQHLPLLVDNAHGAHLVFFSGLHPIAQGADACCDSLHKTLPALTGAALLHLQDREKKPLARRCMSLFGSTSPSYLTLLSADLLLPRWQSLQQSVPQLAQKVATLRNAALEKGLWATQGPVDPVRIALLFEQDPRPLLDAFSIEAEYISAQHLILLPSPDTDFAPLEGLLQALSPCAFSASLWKWDPPAVCCSIREALLSPCKQLPLKEVLGRTAAETLSICPPGIPLIIPGERIPNHILQNKDGNSLVFVVE